MKRDGGRIEEVGADTLVLVDRAISDLVGLRSTAATTTRLAGSVQTRAKARGVRVDAYVELLRDEPDELQAFLELLTVQETSFFRDGAHFTALAEKVLPEMTGKVTLWSAGCSTGQEAYSLGMMLEERGVRDWKIVASDVSRNALERTAAGWYRERELRGLSNARRNRWFRKSDGGWQAVPELRSRVRVVRSNLALDPPPFAPGECSIVFCRNVLIYVRRDRIAAFVRRMADWMPSGGHLFLGASEVLWDIDPRFDLVRLAEGAFAYRRVDDAKARAAASPTARIQPAPKAASPSPAPRPSALRKPEPATMDAEVLRHAGEQAASEGRYEEAVAAFRKALYVDPDDAVAHLHLGLALEATGDMAAGQRAFRAAQAALNRNGRADMAHRLEGYGVAAIRELLQTKLGGQR